MAEKGKKTKMRVKAMLLCLVLAAALILLGGCDSSVDYYTYADEDYYYEQVDITIPTSTLELLEASAAMHEKNGKLVQWNMGDYIDGLAGLLNREEKIKFNYIGDEKGISYAYFTYTRQVPKTDDNYKPYLPFEEYDDDCVMKENLFISRYEFTVPNPFNGLKKRFDDAASVDPAAADELIEILRVGIGSMTENGYEEEFPSLEGAFPAIDLSDEGSLRTRYLMLGSDRMLTTGTKVNIGDNVFYLWDRKLDDRDGTCTYVLFRPNPIGWYIVALALGGIAVGIVFLVAYLKEKKKQPPKKIEDSFPYDPFDGNGSNLPYG